MALHPLDEVRFIHNPALQHLEVRYSRYSKNTFQKHTHDTYAIGVITRGATNLTLYSTNQEAKIPAGVGDVVLINPGQAHACNPLPESDFAYYMLYVDELFTEKLWGRYSTHSYKSLVFNLPIIHDLWLHTELLSQCKQFFTRPRLAPFSNLENLLENIFFLYGDVNSAAEAGPVDLNLLEQSRLYLLSNLIADTPLQTLAKIGGLSPYYFVRAFHQRYGLPPHTYKLQQRIYLAMQRLREGRPVAEVSAEAGFADQSHFTRKFKALVGTTPGHYRQEILTSSTLSE